ncbi:hypothetical protein [Actinoplanes sp. NPDC049265]|uniref:hypothetical protein n=1 Tax=Actinoplanes sp. NPDC049265 TaxID=3363902 RepID=UPI00371A3437
MSRRLLVLAGAGVVLYGALGLLTDPDVQLAGVLIFLVAVLVAHDAVWMPLMLAAIAAVGRIRKNSESTGTRDDGASDE